MEKLFLKQIYDAVTENLRMLIKFGNIRPGQLLVIGASTSEIIGQKIGTHGSIEVAEPIFKATQQIAIEYEIYTAFQCCEHLNRALVVTRDCLIAYPLLEEVTVVPSEKAGGSMATYAYYQMEYPIIIERIQAHAGIDIGDTLIGMHLRHVAVPFRPLFKDIGDAHVTMAYTRPKLIGGARALYSKNQ